jgi:hypothetical protein
VAASADGRWVYVGASPTLARFARELPVPPKPGGPVPPRPPAADTVAPTISRLALKRGRFRFRLSEAAMVRIAIERRRGQRRIVTRAGRAGLNRVRVKLPRGAVRARVVAIDAAGNRSRALTLRLRVARR